MPRNSSWRILVNEEGSSLILVNVKNVTQNMKIVLIDLYTQRQAVELFVSGWTREHCITWLEIFGEVQRPYADYAEGIHYFISIAGLRAYFQFDEYGKFFVNTSGWLC